jgi:hypothetical protein
VHPKIVGAPSVKLIEVPFVLPPSVVNAAIVVAPVGIGALHPVNINVGGQVSVGAGLITTVVVEVQVPPVPLVIVTVYTPAIADVAFGIVGF